MDIEKKIDFWKKHLLDLTKRNRLINFKITSDTKTVLRLIKPSVYELYDTLVVKRKSINFPLQDGAIEEDDGLFSSNTQEQQEYPLSAEISTDKKPKDAYKVLSFLKKKYKTILNEQNVNALYLCLGILEYKEKVGGETLYSPLVLIPISMTSKSLKLGYYIQYNLDEIVVNPTLTYKLQHDYGLEIPNITSETENLNDILKLIKKFADDNKWKVFEYSFLSILSFQKINIYKDIERHTDYLSNNSLIDAFSQPESQEKFNEAHKSVQELVGFNHDTRNLNDIWTVVNADSTQMDAILCAEKGYSFILQGPPGTGKSQTITNIISTLVANGKRVLFVSEKKAALDVVQKRLEDVGLSDFVLSLHNNKENSRDLLNSLENTLNINKDGELANIDESYKITELSALSSQLDEYSTAVNNKTLSSLGKSIFDANGIVLKYYNYKDYPFKVDDISQITPQEYNNLLLVIKRLSQLVQKMNNDISSNPWKGCLLDAYSHNFNQEFLSNYQKLQEQKDDMIKSFDYLKSNSGLLNFDGDFSSLSNINPLLKSAGEASDIPKTFSNTQNLQIVKNSLILIDAAINKFDLVANEVCNMLSSLTAFEVSKTTSAELKEEGKIKEVINELNQKLEVHPILSRFKDNETAKFVLSHKKLVEDINESKLKIFKKFEPKIFDDAEILDVSKRFKTQYQSIFRIFNSSYKNDKRLIQSYTCNNKYAGYRQTLMYLKKIELHKDLQNRFDSERARMQSLFPFEYDGLDTNFKPIEASVESFKQVLNAISLLKSLLDIQSNINNIPDEQKSILDFCFDGVKTNTSDVQNTISRANDFINLSCSKYGDITSEKFIENVFATPDLQNNLADVAKTIDKFDTSCKSSYDWFSSLFNNNENISKLNINDFYDRLEKCKENFNLLEVWIDYCSAKAEILKTKASEFITILEENPINSDDILPVFEKSFFKSYIDDLSKNNKILSTFRKDTHTERINNFCNLDKFLVEFNKKRLKEKLIDNLPTQNDFPTSEIAFLKHEIAKSKRFKPLYEIFCKIPSLIKRLKPIFMMSPLSVSQFLEPELYDFDTVIFDESSQIKTENAVCSIYRGKQVIIAGDAKQLPPTNFFEVIESYEESETSQDQLEESSILEESMFLPQMELLWHYRSKHESLIDFSNKNIYNSRLITFPSPISEKKDLGVEYVFAENGVYSKTGNVKEAELIAELVFKHFDEYPERSLGVITFGTVQEERIERAINKMRLKKPEYEKFFAEDNGDSFFVKSLENVQGDERDTIILSVGYAKNEEGKFNMYFGPLSAKGGERRLNVAITRARINLKLVSSFKSFDIDVSKITQEGPKLLKSFIEFAENRSQNNSSEPQDCTSANSSDFVQVVADLLADKGYKVVQNVGCSKNKIDLAIRNPQSTNEYLLGIESDGPSYSLLRIARDRDRIKNEALSTSGWNIYKIWSTEWAKNPECEKSALLSFVSKINSLNGNSSTGSETR